MNAPTNLLVITASNGHNLKLAERFAAAGQARLLQADIIDLVSLGLPLFTPAQHADHGIPAAVAKLSQKLESTPAWVICTPEYNGSIAPSLTSAIAWLSVQGEDFRRLFNGRPIAIATHSGGGGHTVLAALRLQLAHLGAQVVGRQLVSNQANPAKDSTIDDLVGRLQTLTVATS